MGTAEKVETILGAKLLKDKFDVVSNPEFLREGVAVDDFLKPDRVVIGVNSKQAEETMMKLYEPFVRQGNPIIVMDIRSAELTKYAANAYLATRISFMNEIANLCERLGADVDHVRKGMGSDTRIGKGFVSGSRVWWKLFSKRRIGTIKAAADSDYNFQILDAVMQVNEKQKKFYLIKSTDILTVRWKAEPLLYGGWPSNLRPTTSGRRLLLRLFINF